MAPSAGAAPAEVTGPAMERNRPLEELHEGEGEERERTAAGGLGGGR